MDNLVMVTTGAIIQVRYNSTRLPGKVLLELPFGSGTTLLGTIVARLKKVEGLKVIIATSNEKDDDPIAEEADKLGAAIFRGSKDNVLDRYCEAAKAFSLDTVIRITGDNPIVLTDVISSNVKAHHNGGFDYTRNVNMPYGTSFEIASAKALLKSRELTSDKEEQEHVTLFIKRNSNLFKINEINHFPGKDFGKIRLTVDYPSDYALMNIVCSYFSGRDYTIEDVLGFLDANPWMASINNTNFQKKQFTGFNDELQYAVEVMDMLDLKMVKQKLQEIV